jgi:hypothetical protein
VHLGLMVSGIVSMLFQPVVLVLHIWIGLAFAALVAIHVTQRRHVSVRLLRQFMRIRTLHRPRGRLAIADVCLGALTVGMLVSGFWDWFAGHPTRIRWHALTGFVLIAFLIVHTLNRQNRLRGSHIR